MNKEELKKVYQQNRIIIFPALTAAASLMLILLVIIPQLSKLISNNESYSEIVEKNEFLEVKASELENIDEDDLRQKLDISLAALPTGRDLTETMSLIQSIVSQSGFILQSLQFGTESDSEKQNDFSVRMEVTGVRPLLSGLLNNIEGSYRPMKVTNVDITTSATGDAINAVVNVAVYYAPIPKSVGSIDSPVPKLSAQEQELISELSQATSLVSNVSPTTPTNLPPRGKANPFD